MQMLRILSLLFLVMLYLAGCAQAKPEKTQSVMIVWKSPAFRYADMGFISDSGKRLEAEIYSSGSTVMRLGIDRKSICMNSYSCLPKARFNEKFLSSHYPGDTLENIFRGKPIFGGESLTGKRNSFTQKFKKSNLYNIVYKKFNNQIVFHDTINQIIIKVKRQ
jgi:hypothetical protein